MLKHIFIFLGGLLLFCTVLNVSVQAKEVFDIDDYKGIFISEIHWDVHSLNYNETDCGGTRSNLCTADKWFEITNFSQKNINLNQLAIAKNGERLSIKSLDDGTSGGYVLETNKSVVVFDKFVPNGMANLPEFSNINVFKSLRSVDYRTGVNILSAQNPPTGQLTGYNVNLYLYILNDQNQYELLPGGYQGSESISGTDIRRQTIELCWNSSVKRTSNQQSYATIPNNFNQSNGQPSVHGDVSFYGTPGKPTENCDVFPKIVKNPPKSVVDNNTVTNQNPVTNDLQNNITNTNTSNQTINSNQITTNQNSTSQELNNLLAPQAESTLQITQQQKTISAPSSVNQKVLENLPSVETTQNLTNNINSSLSDINVIIAGLNNQISQKPYNSKIEKTELKYSEPTTLVSYRSNFNYILDNLSYLGLTLNQISYANVNTTFMGLVIFGLTINRFSFAMYSEVSSRLKFNY